MVQIWTILTIYVAILAVHNVRVEAGKGTIDRITNLSSRASVHKDVLKVHEHGLKKNFGTMDEQVVKQLTEINYIIIDHIMQHESFPLYLKNVFLVLLKYAEGQIKSRYEKLQKVYNKWEKINFPDQKKKEAAFKILKSQKKENEGSKKNNVNKPKGKKN